MSDESTGEPMGDADMRTDTPAPGRAPTQFPDITALSYEDARDQLISVVQSLESGQTPLDETMSLWERGEALAEHCSRWLDRAEKRLDERTTARAEGFRSG